MKKPQDRFQTKEFVYAFFSNANLIEQMKTSQLMKHETPIDRWIA